MDKKDSSNNEIDNSNEWKSWTPKQMISVFLHETRTPLSIIKGYAEILSNKEATEHHPEAIESISRAVSKLEDLWDELADYAGELTRKSDT
jgi:signal transduction histidine kinase